MRPEPDKQTPEEPLELELQVVREERRGGARPGAGRPIRLDPRAFFEICRDIERGKSAIDACERMHVSYETLRRRVHKNPKWMRRLRHAEEIREHYLREYHIANIKKHAEKNVAASMFWLERRFPNEFALRTVIRNTGDAGSAAVFDKIPLEQLVENARLAAEIAAAPPPGLSLPAPAEAEKTE